MIKKQSQQQNFIIFQHVIKRYYFTIFQPVDFTYFMCFFEKKIFLKRPKINSGR